MSSTDPLAHEIFFTVHQDLPREGPGSRDCTARALALAAPDARAGEALAVLDIACGPGAQTVDLAQLAPGAAITALDTHLPFLRALQRRADEQHLAGRIAALQADMRALPLAPGSFDLLWCEGAAYIMGLEEALTGLLPFPPLLLQPGLPVDETLVWSHRSTAPHLASFWFGAHSSSPLQLSSIRRMIDGCSLNSSSLDNDKLDVMVKPRRR